MLTVLYNSGTAIMGFCFFWWNRAKEAIVAALDSPLLNDNKITGAKTYCCLSFQPMKLQLMKLEKSMIIFKSKRA
jgi:cell division GTPase FtsZ